MKEFEDSCKKMRTEFPYTPSNNWSGYVPCQLCNVELSTLCLVLVSASVDFHKVKRGLPVNKS